MLSVPEGLCCIACGQVAYGDLPLLDEAGATHREVARVRFEAGGLTIRRSGVGTERHSRGARRGMD